MKPHEARPVAAPCPLAALPRPALTPSETPMSGPRVLPSPVMTEKSWQAQVLSAARLAGWWCFFTHDSRHSPAGMCDLVLVHPARRIVAFRELKTDRGKLRPEQAQAIEVLTAAGADVAVWRPRDADAVWAFLTGKTDRRVP